jgi:hypothetical protein
MGNLTAARATSPLEGIAGISGRVVSMKTGCPSANRDKVRGRPTGSSDEEPQRREEQPDEKVLRWTGSYRRIGNEDCSEEEHALACLETCDRVGVQLSGMQDSQRGDGYVG